MGGAWGSHCSGKQGIWSTEGTIWGILALCNGVRASYSSDASPFATPFSALLTRGRISHNAQDRSHSGHPHTALFVALSACTTSSSSGSTFHPSPLTIHPWLALKHPLHCWILGVRNFVKEESVCRVKTFPFSWSGTLLYPDNFSQKWNKEYSLQSYRNSKYFSYRHSTKHRMFIPK